MKPTDLRRHKGLKIASKIKPFGVPAMPGAPDRRELRRLDQAAGPVPLACKRSSELVKQVMGRAQSSGAGLNQTVAQLLARELARP